MPKSERRLPGPQGRPHSMYNEATGTRRTVVLSLAEHGLLLLPPRRNSVTVSVTKRVMYENSVDVFAGGTFHRVHVRQRGC